MDQSAPQSAACFAKDAALIAREICRRGLAAPAIFLLELSKPMCSVVNSSAVLSDSILKFIFGARTAEVLANLLNSRENLESVIRAIELESRQRGGCKV